MNFQSGVPCPKCGAPLAVSDEITLTYFSGVRLTCGKCAQPIDWWETIFGAVNRDFFLSAILGPIGAQTTHFDIMLRREERPTIKFTDHGVPADAKILEVNYTPQQRGFFPLEMNSNTPIRHIVPRQVTLFPVPSLQKEDDGIGQTRLAVMVTWIHHTAEDEAWRNLVEAFEAFGQSRFNGCVIPANVAVESKLANLMAKSLRLFAGAKVVDDFLENAATYSHQLNMLLPMIVRHLKIPMLSDPIRGRLNRLRGLRNELAHDGRLAMPLDKAATAELIVAALFGFHYLSLVNRTLSKLPSEALLRT